MCGCPVVPDCGAGLEFLHLGFCRMQFVSHAAASGAQTRSVPSGASITPLAFQCWRNPKSYSAHNAHAASRADLSSALANILLLADWKHCTHSDRYYQVPLLRSSFMRCSTRPTSIWPQRSAATSSSSKAHWPKTRRPAQRQTATERCVKATSVLFRRKPKLIQAPADRGSQALGCRRTLLLHRSVTWAVAVEPWTPRDNFESGVGEQIPRRLGGS
jgi:hypothetical protein